MRNLVGRSSRISWRRLGVAALALALVATTALASFAYVMTTHAAKDAAANASGRHGTIAAGKPFHLSRTGVVDWSKLPVMTGKEQADAAALTRPGLPTSAEMAAYAHLLQQKHNDLPHAKAEPAPLAAPTPAQVAQNANFNVCNQYLALPCVTHEFPGRYAPLDQDGNDPYTLTSASNPGYVMQAVEGSYAVYTFTGSLVYGPTSPSTFFAPIMANKQDAMDGPQMFWDATREHWIILEEETQYAGGTTILRYVDIGVSKSQNANLAPSQWYLYQFNTNVNLGGIENDCGYPQLGGDYWGLWISCDASDASSVDNAFLGNLVFALSKNALYSGPGGASPTVNWWTGIPTNISNGSGGFEQALSLTPAEEDGTPDAEFVLATDAGWGIRQNIPTMNGLTIAAFTNTHALATGGAPTLSYVVDQLPVGYADPAPGVNQPSNPPEDMPFFGSGTYQVQYRGGNLYFALTTAVANGSVNDNGAYWAEIQPQLTPLDPAHPQNQMVKDPLIRQDNIWAYGPNQDAYEPTFMASSEDDEVLAFYYSSSTTYPSIVFTARRATDAPNLMGGMNGANQFVTTGTAQLFSVPLYSSCSLDTNLTLRGLFWCTNKYVGPHATSGGWDTWIYALQV